MTPPSTTVFPADALEANRSGTLTAGQRASLLRLARMNRGTQLMMGAILVVGGVMLLRGLASAPRAWWPPWAGAAASAVGVLTTLNALGIGNRLVQDIHEGRVETVEGAIRKRHGFPRSRTPAPPTHYLLVEGRRFAVGPAGFDAAPDVGYVRLFYLPRSRRVVNLEPLPAHVSAGDMLDHPLSALKSFAAAVLSHDPTQRAEALADAAAVAAAWQTDQQRTASDARAAPRDPRPLAEAIVGTWAMGGLLTLDFRADGTVVVRRPIGGDTTGRWSVDPDGRLRSEATGQQQVGEASIAGDVLTLSADGTTLSFHRTR